MANEAHIKQHTCNQCSNTFTGRKKKFCSAPCRVEYHRRLKHPLSWAEYVSDVGLAPKNCEQCGKDFKPAAKKDVSRFCSVTCYGKHRTAQAVEQRERNRLWLKELAVYRRWGKGYHLAERLNRAAVRRAKSKVKCGRCGAEIGLRSSMGAPAKYCSKHCSKLAFRKTDKYRAMRAKRRAKKRSGAGGEMFDPLYILERDGWRCYLCGIKTPKVKRGTIDDDAPEVDHIIPLSKGGRHTKANTACSCRKCNNLKGNGVSGGQLLLIG